MTLFDFRTAKGPHPGFGAGEPGGDYLEYDELLASGAEVALEEDAGYLTLAETGEWD